MNALSLIQATVEPVDQGHLSAFCNALPGGKIQGDLIKEITWKSYPVVLETQAFSDGPQYFLICKLDRCARHPVILACRHPGQLADFEKNFPRFMAWLRKSTNSSNPDEIIREFRALKTDMKIRLEPAGSELASDLAAKADERRAH